MDAIVTPGLIDAILALVALELAAVGLLLARAGLLRLVAPWSLTLAAGAALLLALRGALADSASVWIALALGASFAAHAASVWQAYRNVVRPGSVAAGRAADPRFGGA